MIALPPGFLLGCASAAHQVEGGNHNDWTRFEQEPGRIADGSVSGAACDHWNRYREDLADLAALGQNAHRFSLEWSRIEPEPGRVDTDALDHYVEVTRRCTELGLEPLVTLHHFTLPLWLTDRGGVLAQYRLCPRHISWPPGLSAARTSTIPKPASGSRAAHPIARSRLSQSTR